MNTINKKVLSLDSHTIFQFTIERNTCGPDDITIDIKYCGICHTDVHYVMDDMPMPVPFPLVPGHEIAGVVTQVSTMRDHAT